MQDWISAYLAAQKQAVDSIRPADIAAIVDTLRDAYRRDAQVFACGNGGNAANCSHFVNMAVIESEDVASMPSLDMACRTSASSALSMNSVATSNLVSFDDDRPRRGLGDVC